MSLNNEDLHRDLENAITKAIRDTPTATLVGTDIPVKELYNNGKLYHGGSVIHETLELLKGTGTACVSMHHSIGDNNKMITFRLNKNRYYNKGFYLSKAADVVVEYSGIDELLPIHTEPLVRYIKEDYENIQTTNRFTW